MTFLQNRSMFFLKHIILHIRRVRPLTFLHVWGELRTFPMLTNLPLLLLWWCGSQQVEKIHAARCLSNLYLSPLLVRTTCRRESHNKVNQRLPGFPHDSDHTQQHRYFADMPYETKCVGIACPYQ